MRQVRANDQVVELRRQISHRDYLNLLAQRDHSHYTVHKNRRCFLWHNLYFQLDIYLPPCSPKCEGLVLLETYTTLKSSDVKLPPFLEVLRDVTDDPEFSMFNLSRSHLGATNNVMKGNGYSVMNGRNGAGNIHYSAIADNGNMMTDDEE